MNGAIPHETSAEQSKRVAYIPHATTKPDIIEEIARIVPTFDHVEDLQTCIARLKKHFYDACLIDIGLLNEERFNRFETMRGLQPELALVAVGEQSGELTRKLALRAGVDDVLDYRSGPAELSNQLDSIVRDRRQKLRDLATTSSRRVLLVDDEAEFLLPMMSEALTISGFEVMTASDGYSALEKLRKKHCHVVVTDLAMPGLDGAEVVAAIRRYDASVVPVLMTAYPSVDAAIGALQKGATDFLIKPVGPKQVAAVVEHAWSRWITREAYRRLNKKQVGGTSKKTRVLVIDEAQEDLERVRKALGPGDTPFELTWEPSLHDAIERLSRESFDLIVTEYYLQDCEGLEIIVKLQRTAPHVPLLVLTNRTTEGAAEQAIQCGAQDFHFKKDMSGASLARSMCNAIERHNLAVKLNEYVRDLRASEESQRSALADNADAIFIVTKDDKIRYANRAAEVLFRTSAADLANQPLGIPLDNSGPFFHDVNCNGDGIRVVEVQTSPTKWENEDARVVSLRDTTERKRHEDALQQLNEQLEEANKRIEQLADLDPLTELLNRRGLEKVLFREIEAAGEEDTLLAVLLDCDDFNRINETLGFSVGDLVLVQVAEMMQSALRPGDHAARIGGDEFLFLLPNTETEEGAEIAERVRLAIGESPLYVASKMVQVTASLALVEVPHNVYSVSDLIARAFTALAASKSSGKNQLATPHGLHAIHTIFAADSNPDDISAQVGLYAVAQPIVELATDKVAGFEMLSRGPEGPFKMPEHFLRLAYEQNCLAALDLACLKQCVFDAKGFPEGLDYHVNLYPSTLLDTPVDNIICVFPEKSGGRTFCIEISEQQLLGDPVELLASVEALKEAGVKIAIDDVGYGRSSLESLVLLEPDVVKIDRRFINGISRDPYKLRSLKRLLRALSRLGTQTIAEGIETEADLNQLKQLDVSFGQGYFLGRPANPQYEQGKIP